jgi:hypothetical protein
LPTVSVVIPNLDHDIFGLRKAAGRSTTAEAGAVATAAVLATAAVVIVALTISLSVMPSNTQDASAPPTPNIVIASAKVRPNAIAVVPIL